MWVNDEGENVHDSENDICLIADIGKSDGGDHDDHEVPDPVAGRGEGVGGSPNL